MRFKQGEYVRIVDREATPADAKNGTYYPYFGGLAGTVDRVYDKEICIKVDPESLPKDVSKRHRDIQESIRRKWLDSLSGEARNRLTPEEKRFELAYTILVRSSDLERVKPGKTKPAAIKSARPLKPPKAAVPQRKKEAAPKKTEAPKPSVKSRKAKPAAKAAPTGRAAKPKATKKAAKPAPPKSTAKPATKAAATRKAVKPKAAVKAAAEKSAKTAKAAQKPGAKATPKAAARAASKPAAPKKSSVKASAPKKATPKVSPDKPVTTADLDAAELAFLKQREKALKGERK